MNHTEYSWNHNDVAGDGSGLVELHRRGAGWRLRAVGQGYDHGLADLARGHGVDVAE